MYIQITTYCTMSCEHCCFSCEATKRGEHMDRSTFRKAVRLAEDYASEITLGGGEPTMHPKFWEYFGIAMESDVESVWMATNGSITNKALALAAMSGETKFSCTLSQDAYHDPIDDRVVTAFKRHELEIRDVTNSVYEIGSAIENGLGTRDEGCFCPCPQIKPNGDIYGCGCADALKLGNINKFDYSILRRFQEIASVDGYEEPCTKNIEPGQEDDILGRAPHAAAA